MRHPINFQVINIIAVLCLKLELHPLTLKICFREAGPLVEKFTALLQSFSKLNITLEAYVCLKAITLLHYARPSYGKFQFSGIYLYLALFLSPVGCIEILCDSLLPFTADQDFFRSLQEFGPLQTVSFELFRTAALFQMEKVFGLRFARQASLLSSQFFSFFFLFF